MAPGNCSRTMVPVFQAATGVVLLLLLYLFAGKPYGQLEAYYDLARGHYKLKRIGHVYPWTALYHQRLKERYHVQVDIVAMCMPSIWEHDYWEGYNSISKPIINKLVDPADFRECSKKAILSYMESNDLSVGEKAFCERVLQRLH